MGANTSLYAGVISLSAAFAVISGVCTVQASETDNSLLGPYGLVDVPMCTDNKRQPVTYVGVPKSTLKKSTLVLPMHSDIREDLLYTMI